MCQFGVEVDWYIENIDIWIWYRYMESYDRIDIEEVNIEIFHWNRNRQPDVDIFDILLHIQVSRT